MYMRFLLLCVSLFFAGGSFCQAQRVWYKEVNGVGDTIELRTQRFTGVTLRIEGSVSGWPKIKMGEKYRQIQQDNHVRLSGQAQSLLYLIEDSVLHLSGCSGIRMELIFQYVPALDKDIRKASFRSKCEKPSIVPQSVWRAGLQAPKPNPGSTSFRHAIVHHSAGGNGNTDYTTLVRNYYVHHTQVNGWDDIGYNFLIAYDGTIFAGRDPQTLSVEQYEVKGAHFCGKNNGTSGVCLIGDYTKVAPSDTMLGSLTRLLSWIFFKEKRKATDSSRHPGAGDPFLHNISGHKEGCATLCPGDSVFIRLAALRTRVETERKICDQAASIAGLGKEEQVFFRSKSKKLIIPPGKSRTYAVFSVSGRKALAGGTIPGQFNHIDCDKLPAGIYVLYLGSYQAFKFVVPD